MNTNTQSKTRCFSLLIAAALTTSVNGQEHSHGRLANHDARIEYNADFVQEPGTAQRQSAAAMALKASGLHVRYSKNTGAASSVSNRAGYLSEPRPELDVRTLASDFLYSSRQLLGLSDADLDTAVLADVVPSISGATHLYYEQSHLGIPVYGSRLQVHVNREGRILRVTSSFLPRLAEHAPRVLTRVDAAGALRFAAADLGREVSPKVLYREKSDTQRTTFLQLSEHVPRLIEAQLFWLPIRSGDARLVWNLHVPAEGDQDVFDMTVDASTGQVWTRFNTTHYAEYRVYEAPIESPHFTSPLPTSDARTLAVNPADATASPQGWHSDGTTSYTTTQGNNIKAFVNGGSPVDCGSSLSCDFPLDLSLDPSSSKEAAVANAFYWTNYIHDVQYQYGFDEAAGNFQENNFGNGGLGSDSINVKVQYSTYCNASFSPTVDGSNPTIKLYKCDNDTPKRDGAYDNGVIVHEYGHGISTRQVGGSSTASCLYNTQQPGEGWSDWFGLVYTATPGDAGTDQVGRGSWLYAHDVGETNRPQPYSTDPAINDYTYATIDSGVSIPHGVGSVWAQALWEVYWALVDAHGYESDLLDFDLNDPNEAGNKRALFYVNEGLKLTDCSPTFLAARDAVLDAARDNFGGADHCLIWQAFANFGLGDDATTGGATTTDATDGFAMPDVCPLTFSPVAAEDGWLRESSESSNVGDFANATGTHKRAIRAGDTVTDKQYKSILSFDTSGISDGATIRSATLRLRRGLVTGQNPFDGGFGSCSVDVSSGGFSGASALEVGDFQASATATAAATMSSPAANGDWSEGSLNTTGLAAVSTTGTTQFRIYFATDDNDNSTADYIGFASGDHADSTWWPELEVSYLE